ncbi:MAG: CAP domain-containing protein [candidate division KSB1 bacterium]|nr:CAP domain-containing protein [candidate division KSB1 bacterium]MDQ7066479.1 CAP domain-containing protein [candidate division KSB1 bacterium]
MNSRIPAVVACALFFTPIVLRAQSHWNLELYKQISLSDFRQFEPFHQPIDLQNPDIPLLNAALFYVTNEQRKNHDRAPLEYLPALEIMAFQHSKRMTKWVFFSHRDPVDPERKNPQKRASLAGITNPYVAENIIRLFVTPGQTYLQVAEAALQAWMNSKGHRQNILSRGAVQLGCGAYLENQFLIATQNFQHYEGAQLRAPEDLLPGGYSYPWWEYHSKIPRKFASSPFSKALVLGIAREVQYYWGTEMFRTPDEQEYLRMGFPTSAFVGFTFWRYITIAVFSRWGVHNQYRIGELIRQQELTQVFPDTSMHAFPYKEFQIGFLFGDYIRASFGKGQQTIRQADGVDTRIDYYIGTIGGYGHCDPIFFYIRYEMMGGLDLKYYQISMGAGIGLRFRFLF